MQSIRSTISLIDNFSATMSRFIGGSNKITQSAEQMQTQLSRSTDFADSLSSAERMLDLLRTQYDEQVVASQKIKEKYAEEEMAINRLAEQYEKLKNTSKARGTLIPFEATNIKLELEESTKALARYKAELFKAEKAEIKTAESIEKLERALNKEKESAEEAARKQDEFNNALRRGSSAADSLVGKLKGFVGAYLGLKGLKKLFQGTIDAFAQLNQKSMMMQAAFGNTDIGASYFNSLQKYALKTGQKMEDLTEVTRNFMQLTKHTDKLRGLTEIANRMSLRTSNIGSAEVLMQEAMRGQYTRLQRTLHLTDSQIEPLRRAVQAGSLEGIIGAFDQALNTAGLTNEIVEAFQASPLQRFNRILASFKQKLAGAGEQALERLTPLLERVDRWLQSDSATRFFNAVAFGISELAKGFMFIVDLVQSNWPTVQSILIMAGALIMYNIVASLWATIPPLIAQMAPFLIIIGLIYMIVKAYIEMGGTLEEVTGFIGGLFGGLYATVYNAFVQIYNLIATVAEFFVNVWHNPMFAVKKLFVGFVDSILGMLQRVTDAMDFVFKTNMSGAIQGWRDNLNKLVEEVPENYKVIERMKEISFEDTVSKGYDIGKLMPDKIREGINSVTDAINNMSATESLWNAKQLDTLGSIDGNTKQLTEEDLKWLRDSAEQEAVNRFTAATLAPQISLQFGDIRETADVDGIVDHVQKVLTDLLNTTAEGVHA